MKTSKAAKKGTQLNARRPRVCVLAQVYVAPDAVRFLNEVGNDLRGNVSLETLIQTAFNYGLNSARRDREQSEDAALSYLMENAPERRRAALPRSRRLAA